MSSGLGKELSTILARTLVLREHEARVVIRKRAELRFSTTPRNGALFLWLWPPGAVAHQPRCTARHGTARHALHGTAMRDRHGLGELPGACSRPTMTDCWKGWKLESWHGTAVRTR